MRQSEASGARGRANTSGPIPGPIPGPILPRSRPHRGIGHELREQPFASHLPAISQNPSQKLPGAALRFAELQLWIRGSRTLLFMLYPLTLFIPVWPNQPRNAVPSIGSYVLYE